MSKRKKQQKCLMKMMSTMLILKKLLMRSFSKRLKIKKRKNLLSLRKRRSLLCSRLWREILMLMILKLNLNLRSLRLSMWCLRRMFNSRSRLSLPRLEKIRLKFLLNLLLIRFISELCLLELHRSLSVLFLIQVQSIWLFLLTSALIARPSHIRCNNPTAHNFCQMTQTVYSMDLPNSREKKPKTRPALRKMKTTRLVAVSISSSYLWLKSKVSIKMQMVF